VEEAREVEMFGGCVMGWRSCEGGGEEMWGREGGEGGWSRCSGVEQLLGGEGGVMGWRR
jgi:hypothetical protein